MARVLLIGTFETKQQELTYFAAALRAQGLEVELLDVSLESKGAIWSGAEKLAQMAVRAEAGCPGSSAPCSCFLRGGVSTPPSGCGGGLRS